MTDLVPNTQELRQMIKEYLRNTPRNELGPEIIDPWLNNFQECFEHVQNFETLLGLSQDVLRCS